MDETRRKQKNYLMKLGINILLILFGIAFVVYELAMTKSENFMTFTSVVYIVFSILAALLIAFTAVKARNFVLEGYRATHEPLVLEKTADEAKHDVKFGLYFGLALNVAFALMQLYFGLVNNVPWFYCFFFLYLLFAAIRLVLSIQIKKRRLGVNLMWEHHIQRLVAMIIMIINTIVSAITFYIAHQNRGFEYPYWLTIYMIGYNIWLLGMALFNLIKFRKYSSPILNSLTWVNLVFALITILILETCLFYTFGHGAYSEIRCIVTGMSGAIIITIIWIISFSMVIDSTSVIHKLRRQQDSQADEWLQEQKNQLVSD